MCLIISTSSPIGKVCCYCLVDHVAVIDEIQMIADPERGGAWTRAILGIISYTSCDHIVTSCDHIVMLAGVPAKVIHVCGEPTGIPLVERLVEACNDTIEVGIADTTPSYS